MGSDFTRVFTVSLLMGVMVGIAPVLAEDITSINGSANNTQVIDSDMVLTESEVVSNSSEESSFSATDEDLSVKVPKTELVYAPANLTETGVSEQQTADEESSNESSVDNTTNSSPKYESLGDIIKAKDWKALGEYNCKVKAENPEKFDESGVGSGDATGRWNSYFTAPPTMIYTPCCG